MNRRGYFLRKLGLAALTLLVVFVITPRMASIWHSVPHAVDGSGLMGDDRRAFMRLHGIANLCYMSMMALGAVQIVIRALGRAKT